MTANTVEVTTLYYIPATRTSVAVVDRDLKNLRGRLDDLYGWMDRVKTVELRGDYGHEPRFPFLLPSLISVGETLVRGAGELGVEMSFHLEYATEGRFANDFVLVLDGNRDALLQAIKDATDNKSSWAGRILDLHGINVGHGLDLDISIYHALVQSGKRKEGDR